MGKTITILGLETSCDETAAAIVRLNEDGTRQILSNQLYSQIATHAPYGGVVPELAARAHIQHLPDLLKAALKDADCKMSELDGVAATAGPGLIGGVLVGLTMGKALALAAEKPFIGINHLEAHALTARLTEELEEVAFPYLLLLVSGGHCQLWEVRGVGEHELYGSTRDDAVGEAFDKAAKLLGLGYPGGPAIEAQAKKGEAVYDLPRPLINASQGDKDILYDFSFSGLKTALVRCAEKLAPVSEKQIADLAASLQAAIGDCLVDRSANALKRFKGVHHDTPHPAFVMAGGVAANLFLRERLGECATKAGFRLVVPPPALCTDNAAMVAWAGIEYLRADVVGERGMGVAAFARAK